MLRARWARYTLTGFMTATTIATTGCSVSTQQEVEMGAQYSSEINRQLPLVSDAQVHAYINQLGDQIARAGNRGLNYTFYVVNSDQINAFAVPGGYIYINRGLLQRASNASEVAGVLAHEIGHVERRHGIDQMEKMQRASLGLNLAYVLMGRQPSAVESTAINAGGSLVFAKFSRDDENEADESAIPLMLASGYHPNGLITMFQRLLSMQNSSVALPWFSTHPTTQDRINATRAAIGRVPASQLRGLTTDTRAFQNIKARLRSLPAAPRNR